MKQLARILSLAILVSAALFFAACDNGGGGEKSEKEVQIEKLAGTWTVTSVTQNTTTDHTADYDAFTLQITRSSSEAMTYTTAGRPSGEYGPWNASGTLTFGTPVASQLMRSDNQAIGYSVNNNTLTLTFENYPGDAGYLGRVGTVEGDWVFVMTK